MGRWKRREEVGEVEEDGEEGRIWNRKGRREGDKKRMGRDGVDVERRKDAGTNKEKRDSGNRRLGE